MAGTIGVIGLTFLAPLAADVAVNFGPPEYSALMVFALLLVIMLAGDSMLKGFISMFIGLFLATIGTDLFSGEQRFTGGQIELAGGIEFIALSVGIFAIGEVLVNIEDKTEKKLFKVPKKLRELLPSKQDIKKSTPAMLQGGIVGFLIGILPGAGSTVASFVSYIIAKKTSKTPEEFGNGSIEGVAAPEAANNSETGGAMVPSVDHGHPRIRHGRSASRRARALRAEPGPLLFHEHADVVWPIIASMYLGNVVLVIMNLPMVPFFAKLLNTPYKVLYPAIILISVVGVYSVNFSLFDVGLLAVFGLLGYAMRKLDIPPAPLVLAFVLGPIAENSIRQSLLLSDNSPIIYLQRPISAVLIGVAVLLLLVLTFGRRARKVREQVIEIDA